MSPMAIVLTSVMAIVFYFDISHGSVVSCVVVPQWEVGRVANDAVPPPRDGVGWDLDYITKVLRVLLVTVIVNPHP